MRLGTRVAAVIGFNATDSNSQVFSIPRGSVGTITQERNPQARLGDPARWRTAVDFDGIGEVWVNKEQVGTRD